MSDAVRLLALLLTVAAIWIGAVHYMLRRLRRRLKLTEIARDTLRRQLRILEDKRRAEGMSDAALVRGVDSLLHDD